MRVFQSIGVALLLAFVFVGSAQAADELPPAAEWMPDGALLAVEISGAEEILELALGQRMIDTVSAMPGVKAAQQTDGFAQAQAVLGWYEARIGTDWKTAVKTLLGGGVTLAVYPDESILLVVDSQDAKILEATRDFLTKIAEGDAAKKGRPGQVSSGEYRGVTGWKLGPNESHAVIGTRFIVSNKPERLKSVIDLREDGGRSLAQQSQFKAAKAAAGEQADAVVMVNMAVVNQLPGVQKALAGVGNPMGSLLLAGVAQSLGNSKVLTLALDVSGETIAIDVVADGKADEVAFARTDGQGALPNLKVPGFLAGASFYRDLHGFYDAKDKLFPERTSQLILFENMMGIFFSGRDLTEDVLVAAEPEIRLLVAQQCYDEKIGTPKTQIPGFAVVFKMKDPENFSKIMEEAWQKAVGLVNFTRGQQAEPGLIIDKPLHGETQFTVARFAAPKVEEHTDADMRFNFSPALAMPNEYLILSSSEGLARDLIDAVKKEAADTIAGIDDVHSLVELDGVNLASILSVNREPLVRNNMLKDDNTRGEAETAIDLLLAIAKTVGQTKFEIGDETGVTRARLSIELQLAGK